MNWRTARSKPPDPFSYFIIPPKKSGVGLLRDKKINFLLYLIFYYNAIFYTLEPIFHKFILKHSELVTRQLVKRGKAPKAKKITRFPLSEEVS
ncbi:MAG: hypothetical protein D3910_02390 [Candidatus Electrothrix sp. ATG2]|nr:hypothetical protein [Candidatus Electrothrix sp. ATG2]